MKIKIENPELLFFTSDTHFSHRSIISHANRPFRDLKEHDESLVENWNKVVPKDGIVVFQGDFALGLKSTKLKWILETLNYDKLYLVQGNHEKDIMNKFWAREYFEMIAQRIEFEIKDDNGKFADKTGRKFNVIVADHYPMLSWNKSFHGSYHTYGHSHNISPDTHPRKNAYEVGVDANNFTPISYFELMNFFKNR
ncbi:hypothetical protein K9L67_05965 [Candidatus Woesearchaeota archaeon]|nr:hypothetical protein [Candidatus Woesearchaeota archaeon]MCF7901740.1 hypothetical protein [Candidatus Woesearchaeota archaeon]